MKKNLTRWLRRCQLPLMLLLSVMPIMLTTLCLHAPDMLGVSGILFAAYTAAAALCLLVPGSRRMSAAVLCSAALLALSAVILPLRPRPLLLLFPAALIVLLFFSLPLAARKFESDIPPYVYFIGVAIHLVIQFLHHYFGSYDGGSPYEPVAPALTASLIGYMLLFLLSMNRISLDNASLARHRIPAGMRAVNTAMTLLFLGASLLLAVIPAIVHAVIALWHALLYAVTQALSFLVSLLPAAADIGPGMQGAPGLMFPQGDAIEQSSAFAVLIQKIMSVVTMIIFIAGCAALIYLISRLVSRLARHIIARLRIYMTAAAAEYEDEITDTREDGAQREIRFLRRKTRAAQEAAATPQGRIRQGYARLLRHRPQWSASSTARENLPESAAALYERARYSEHPVSAEDADRFASEIRKV